MQKEKSGKVGFIITFAIIGFGLFGAPVIGRPVNLNKCPEGEIFRHGTCWAFYDYETTYEYYEPLPETAGK